MFSGFTGSSGFTENTPEAEARGRGARKVPAWLPVAAVVLCYFLLGLGRALTTTPWNDEAWYSSPSWNLIQHGTTGTPLLETAGRFWRGINVRTYWVVPLQFFVQVPWFKVFGFSLLSARFFAMAWGLAGLLSWGWIVKRLTGSPVMGWWTMLLLAVDYQFVSQMSLDRMDAMSLGLAALAILAYLALRESRLALAVLASQTCVAACGLTHPTPGIPVFCAVLFLILYFDRRRLHWKLVVLGAIPYFIFAAGWYWYISFAPDLFRAQFLGNVTDLDRLGGFHHPLRAMAREFRRHIDMGGFGPGMASLYRIKILSVLVYFLAAAGLFSSREARRDPTVRPLLGLWIVYVVLMTFYDNTKEVKYAVHLVPIYDAVVAVWLVRLWRRGNSRQWLAAGAAAVFFAVNIGGLLYTTLVKDDYHKAYLPVAQYLQTHAAASDLILAGSEFGFAMGFDRNLVDDDRLTYFSHKTAQFIVVSPNYQGFIEADRRTWPPVYHFIENQFAEHYEKVYAQQGYEIFERRKNAQPLP